MPQFLKKELLRAVNVWISIGDTRFIRWFVQLNLSVQICIMICLKICSLWSLARRQVCCSIAKIIQEIVVVWSFSNQSLVSTSHLQSLFQSQVTKYCSLLTFQQGQCKVTKPWIVPLICAIEADPNNPSCWWMSLPSWGLVASSMDLVASYVHEYRLILNKLLLLSTFGGKE